MAKEQVRNLVGVIIFYVVIAFGVISLCMLPEDNETQNNNITIKYQK